MNELSLLNTLFGDDNYGLAFPSLPSVTAAMPKVDVKETQEAYILDMELPGRTEKDVSLDLNNRILTISSILEEKNEKKEEKAEKKDGVQYLLRERRTSSFTRRFTLPEDINDEAVNATFKNGVLTVTVPRKAVSQARKIAITAA